MSADAANRVLDRALKHGPRCGAIILIGIDGRSGAGKTTLAERVATLAQEAGLRVRTIHVDELCPGWDGLPEVPTRLLQIVTSLSRTGSATHPTWDWIARQPGPDARISDIDLVIIEGVAALDPAWAERRSASVWVDAPAPLRKKRAIARDGDNFARHWDQWAAAEDSYFATRPTAAQADIVLGGG